MVGIWFFAISPLQERLRVLSTQLEEVQFDVQRTRRTVEMAEEFEAELEAAVKELAQMEQGVAKGDVYRWMVNVLLRLQEQFRIEFTQIEQPAIGELKRPPKAPYLGATFAVTGTATYHQFGRFLAELEGRFGHMRLLSLELEPASYVELSPAEPGKLTFKMEVLVLAQRASNVP
jgi:hypothetical protein